MKIFVDANILVSVLNKEYPSFSFTSKVLSLADRPPFEIYTSPICLAIAFYFAQKKCGAAKAKEKMAVICQKIKTAVVSEEAVHQALANKKIKDFEDGLEYYAALAQDCSAIITFDKNDFYFSEIELFLPEDFLERIARK